MSTSAARRRVALIGAPTDINSSFLRGPAKAPAAIRQALWSPAGNTASEGGLELGSDILVDDVGDLPLTETAEDDTIITQATGGAISTGRLPIVLGGDHSISFAAVRGVCLALDAPVQILHFDAHPDLYADFEGNPRSHASPFARILEQGLASRIVQVGIRTLNRHCREQAERYGVEVIGMTDFSPASVPVLEGPLYISIDLDGLDPAYAPGVSHHEPGGLSVRQVLDVLSRQTAVLAGADIVELNPDRDLHGMTAAVAAKFVKELASRA